MFKTHKEYYKKSTQILDQIDRRSNIDELDQGYFRSQFGVHVYAIANKYGEFHAVGENLNKSIVQYARSDENVCAIMGNDSDFMLYNLGSVKYWLCGSEHFNIFTYCIISFSQKEMLKYLKLAPHHFHVMVAALKVLQSDECRRNLMKTI